MGEDHDGPMLGGEATKGSLQRITERHAVGRVTGVVVAGIDAAIGWASTLAPQQVEAGADEEASHPGLVACRLAQAGEISPRTETCFLDGVLGERSIASHQRGGGVHPIDGHADDGRIGVVVAGTGPFHQLVHSVLMSRSRCSHRVWRRRHGIGSIWRVADRFRASRT